MNLILVDFARDMDGKETLDSELSWEFGAENGGYLFGSDYKESSMLSEFGWNIPADSSGLCGCDGVFVNSDRIDSDLARSRADGCDSMRVTEPVVVVEENTTFASNPSMSSSSSEDRSEKSTVSGGSTSVAATNLYLPPDTA